MKKKNLIFTCTSRWYPKLVYKIFFWYLVTWKFTSWFGAVELILDKYFYFGYGIGFDLRWYFSLSNEEFVKYVNREVRIL